MPGRGPALAHSRLCHRTLTICSCTRPVRCVVCLVVFLFCVCCLSRFFRAYSNRRRGISFSTARSRALVARRGARRPRASRDRIPAPRPAPPTRPAYAGPAPLALRSPAALRDTGAPCAACASERLARRVLHVHQSASRFEPGLDHEMPFDLPTSMQHEPLTRDTRQRRRRAEAPAPVPRSALGGSGATGDNAACPCAGLAQRSGDHEPLACRDRRQRRLASDRRQRPERLQGASAHVAPGRAGLEDRILVVVSTQPDAARSFRVQARYRWRRRLLRLRCGLGRGRGSL